MEKNRGGNEAYYTAERLCAKGPYSCFLRRRFLAGSHSGTYVPLFLVVIRLVAQRDLLFYELPEPFAVDAQTGRRSRRRGVPDDLRHRAEEPGGAEQGRGIAALLHVIQKEPSVLVTLIRRRCERPSRNLCKPPSRCRIEAPGWRFAI